MKTAGIIAEFNPFHNGHQYLIEEAKKTTGADFCIVVMSGDFVQRGAPAMTNKYIRTQMALQNGADLVVELPVCYATGSADFFARGAVSLLDKIGVTDYLFFGSECGSIRPLLETARLLYAETPSYQAHLKNYLKNGMTFPAARLKALDLAAAEHSTPLPSGTLDSPNNILGTEYCKSLLLRNSSIRPFTLKRKGADFHDTQLPAGQYCSASAIRKHLDTQESHDLLEGVVPQNILPLLKQFSGGQVPVCENDFSLLLHYKLLLDASTGYAHYLDITSDLSDKIKKYLFSYSCFHDFALSLKSKDLTFTRINRCLLHILLDIYDKDITLWQAHDYILYARILGLRQNAGELLHAIKKNASIPLLSKLADAPDLLTETGRAMLQKDIHAAHIYDIIYSAKYHLPPVHEYTRQLIYI